MYNTNIPPDRELPSTAQLIKSTIIAAITAIILLVTVVMPAEYGVDPTGLGQVTGLKRMGEIKMSLAAEASAEEPKILQPTSVEVLPESTPPQAGIRTDDMQVTLAPDEGTEIKVTLQKGKKVQYSWTTNGGKANFDVHGDSKELNINYHGYGKGSEQAKQGEIVAAFDGHHGWFWRNRTSETMTVTLKTTGEYSDIKHMK